MSKNLFDKYDMVYHIYKENPNVSRIKKIAAIKKLFPDVCDDKSAHKYDKYLTGAKIAMYAYYRALGNTAFDAAHLIDLSNVLMGSVLKGQYVSVETFVEVIEAELKSRADIKSQHVARFHETASPLLYLQTMYSADFPKDTIGFHANIDLGFDGNVEDELKRRGVPLPNIDLSDMVE